MKTRTAEDELHILRVSLARIAQACGPTIESEIPGAGYRVELGYLELVRLAQIHARGWNRLAAFIVGHCRGET
jgi:hypothetical protein